MNKYDYSFKAIWTICNITLVSDNEDLNNNIINQVYKIVINFENKFSRFKETSELSMLNKFKKYDVNDDFLTLMSYSKDIYRLTEWYFNPLINVSNIWYSNSFELSSFIKHNEDENLDLLSINNFWNTLVLENWMNLDFWSIAKWFLADKIWLYLRSKGFFNYLVNLGWDITSGWLNHLWQKWKIWITNPLDNTKIVKEIEITNNSISTSWIYLRKWNIDNKEYHHIKTPNSNLLSNDILSCSIIDKYWYMTDALATAIISMWLKKWITVCNKNSINYYIIDNNWEIFTNIEKEEIK